MWTSMATTQDRVIYQRLQDTTGLMLNDAHYQGFAFKPHYGVTPS